MHPQYISACKQRKLQLGTPSFRDKYFKHFLAKQEKFRLDMTSTM